MAHAGFIVEFNNPNSYGQQFGSHLKSLGLKAERLPHKTAWRLNYNGQFSKFKTLQRRIAKAVKRSGSALSSKPKDKKSLGHAQTTTRKVQTPTRLKSEVKMPLLEIENLRVEIGGKEILKGLDLAVNAGEVHAIMGPNGSGKSTLAYVLAGKEGYQPTAGEVSFDGRNIFEMAPDERAAAGLFLAFQYPLEIPGVATMTFLRTALNAQRKKRGEAELSTPEFLKKVRGLAKTLGVDPDMLRRAVNVGFSGGEKKRNEILQMALLEPRLAVLDETDSGLDIDALKIVADGVNRLRGPGRSFIVITHYQRLLNYIVPDVVHVLSKGRIVKTGGKELALELEARGYAEYQEEAAA